MNPFPLIFTDPTIDFLCIGPLVLILLDILSGITRAAHDNTFAIRRVADFLGTSFLRYAIAFVAMMFLWYISGSAATVIIAGAIGMATFSASIVASILENLSLSGLPPTVEKELDTIAEVAGKVVETPPSVTKSPMASIVSEERREVSDDTDKVCCITHVITAKLPAWRPS